MTSCNKFKNKTFEDIMPHLMADKHSVRQYT